MGKITVETCEIEGLKVITPTVFGDERGYFMETYNYNDYKAAGSTLITITASDDNTLAKMSDHNISYYVNDVRTEEMSRTTQVPALSIIEILSNTTQRICHNTLQ